MYFGAHIKNIFDKESIKLAIIHLIRECYLTVGDKVFVIVERMKYTKININ